MSWREAYNQYAHAAGHAIAWLERGEFPEDIPHPRELDDLDNAYEAISSRIPKRNRRARRALEDFHREFGVTIHKLQTFGLTPELLELRLLRLDGLFEDLIPHSLALPRKYAYAFAIASSLGAISYIGFPRSLRPDVTAENTAGYLVIVGVLLILFAGLVAAAVLKGIRTGQYVGTTGVFLLMPSLLNLVFVFAWAYWVPSTSPNSCLNAALTKLDAVYFSLTTFTTTGFGDLAPVTSLCRIIAVMQMITTFVIVSALLTVYLGRASTSSR